MLCFQISRLSQGKQQLHGPGKMLGLERGHATAEINIAVVRHGHLHSLLLDVETKIAIDHIKTTLIAYRIPPLGGPYYTDRADLCPSLYLREYWRNPNASLRFCNGREDDIHSQIIYLLPIMRWHLPLNGDIQGLLPVRYADRLNIAVLTVVGACITLYL